MVAVKANTIRRGRKFEQVLEGARVIFLRDGFEAASVDAIAQQAGVSKATLYSYFPDKKLLFLEASRTECARQAAEAQSLVKADTPAPEMLTFIGYRIVAFMTSDFGLALFRLGVAEAIRFPEIGREFYQAGPLLLREKLSEYLEQATGRGELAISDTDLAADQFALLCSADIRDRLLYGVSRTISKPEAKRIVDAAVAMFLARYAVSSGPVSSGPR